MSKVMVVIGSGSDKEKIEPCLDTLTALKIDYKLFIRSAHRTPEETADLAKTAISQGYSVIIAAAGMAAALPGCLAAHTILPVIGVPLNASPLTGLDALYATVQMPSGVPVAVVAIDGAKNAGILAAQILAVSNSELAAQLVRFKQDMARDVMAANN